MEGAKVFVIEADSIEGYYIYGIFSTKEKAEEEKIRCENRNAYDVEHFGYDAIYYAIKQYTIH